MAARSGTNPRLIGAMTRDDAAERSTSEPGHIALPPHQPRYVTVDNDDTGRVHGYLAFWREDEWIYAEEDATTLYDWTDDHK